MIVKQRIGKLAELSEVEGMRVSVDGKDIAVFRKGSRVYAVGDSCPHMGASLSEGYLDGKQVVCPWHGWVFSLEDGSSPFDPDSSLPVYRVVLEEGEVFVEVDTEAGTDACPGSLRRNLP